MSDWQPIETAPKDGTWLMLWRPHKDGRVMEPMILGRWSNDYEAWVWPDDTADVFLDTENADAMIHRGDNYFDAGFTHWMPLPEPPHAP